MTDGGTGVDDPVKVITDVAATVATGNGWLVAAAFVSFLTWGLRAGLLSRLGRPGRWLATNPIASFLTPFVLSLFLGLLTTVGNGGTFTFETFMQETLKIGSGAVAAYIGVKKVEEAKQAPLLEATGLAEKQRQLDQAVKEVTGPQGNA